METAKKKGEKTKRPFFSQAATWKRTFSHFMSAKGTRADEINSKTKMANSSFSSVFKNTEGHVSVPYISMHGVSDLGVGGGHSTQGFQKVRTLLNKKWVLGGGDLPPPPLHG